MRALRETGAAAGLAARDPARGAARRGRRQRPPGQGRGPLCALGSGLRGGRPGGSRRRWPPATDESRCGGSRLRPGASARGSPSRRGRSTVSRPLFAHPIYDPAPEADRTPPPAGRPAAPPGTPRSGARAGDPDTPFGRLIGQYRSSFLLLEDEAGLVIVDQHVAHERVLYDRIRRRLAGERVAVAGAARAECWSRSTRRSPRRCPGSHRCWGGPASRPSCSATPRCGSLRCRPSLGRSRSDRCWSSCSNVRPSSTACPSGSWRRSQQEVAASLSCRAAITVNHSLDPVEQRALLADLAVTDRPLPLPARAADRAPSRAGRDGAPSRETLMRREHWHLSEG